MTTQPEALRLAAWMDDMPSVIPGNDSNEWHKAAAELRRLHAANIDCVNHFNALIDERNELLEIAKSVEGLVSNVDCSSGVCCCGDSMEGHSDPMYCGHTPTDSGWYAASSLLEKARAAIAKATGEQA